MRIGRREFLKYCIGSAAALGLPLSALGNLEKAFAAGSASHCRLVERRQLHRVHGISGQSCSAARRPPISPTCWSTPSIWLFTRISWGLPEIWRLITLIQATKGDFILAVDGGIPTAFGGSACMVWTENGKEVTALEAVQALAPKAKAVLCIGTCASFGGIPAGNPNPTGIKSVRDASGRSTINIPGCPTHPDWIVWTVAQLLSGATVALDSYGRPASLFGSENRNVHERCPREDTEETNTFGVEGRCLKELGCKGPRTQADCPVRKWNSGTNWCVGANAICLGCTESGFPDKFSPFYTKRIFLFGIIRSLDITDTIAPSITMFALPLTSNFTYGNGDPIRHGQRGCDWLPADRNGDAETFSECSRMEIDQPCELYICFGRRQNAVCLGQGCGRECIVKPIGQGHHQQRGGYIGSRPSEFWQCYSEQSNDQGYSGHKQRYHKADGDKGRGGRSQLPLPLSRRLPRSVWIRPKRIPCRMTFKPTARRTYTATLRIHSNDPDMPIRGIALSGTGI